MLKKVLGIFVVSFVVSSSSFSQQKKPATNGNNNDLQARRTELLNQIQESQALLQETKQNATVTLSQLRALNAKLDARQKLIDNISTEMKVLGSDINTTAIEINNLNAQLSKLRAQYAQSVRYAYKNQESQNLMAFVFSSNNFNEMLRRMEYMKKIREYRTNQADKIRTTQDVLAKKVGLLNSRKTQRTSLLTTQESQKKAIEQDALQTNAVAQQLKGMEKDLTAKISRDRISAIQLENAIKEQIRLEIELARKKAEAEAKLRAIAEAKIKAEADAKRKAEEATRLADAARIKAANDERKRIEEAEAKAIAARQKAANDAEKQRLKDIEDARNRREQAAAEEKAIADAKVREKQRIKNEERNKEIDKIKERERQHELDRQKKIAADLEAEKNKIKKEAKSNSNVVVTNNNEPVRSSEINNSPNKTEPLPKSSSESNAYKYTLAPDVQTLSNSFEANRGRLPWPVDRGYIAAPYGNYKHPLEKSVTLNNSGIDIATGQSAAVKVVFAGVVTKIFNVPGMGMTVLVSHGEYFTVYSRLSSASVSVGTKLTGKQVIGTVGVSDDGENLLHFEVWKVGSNNSISNTNPSNWIAPK